MGIYPTLYEEPKKRNDYTKEEIEKKYSNLELSRLILYNLIHNYAPLRIFPERLCFECGKNKISERFQLSDNSECQDCYEKEKKRNYDYMLKIISEEKLEFEGDCIIENKLYLGSIKSSFIKEELKKLGITHILMVGYYMTPIYPNDFIYGNIEVNDNSSENILQYLIEGIKFIEESKICYTHCQVGRSRSAAFVMAYVMYKNKMHFSKAFDLVRKKRHIAFPNEGFQCQLEDFDIILNNFDYDLDKCDEFIKDFMKKRKSLEESEKEYLEKRFEDKKAERFGKYSESESEEEVENEDSKVDNNEIKVKDNNEENKEIEGEKNENKEKLINIEAKEEKPVIDGNDNKMEVVENEKK